MLVESGSFLGREWDHGGCIAIEHHQGSVARVVWHESSLKSHSACRFISLITSSTSVSPQGIEEYYTSGIGSSTP